MSPTKRASAVQDRLRQAAAGATADTRPTGAGRPEQDENPKRPARIKPVRVTLNFPPDLFRQLDRWAFDAADTIGAPRIGVQDAVRAMVRVITSGDARNAESQIFAELRRQHVD